MNIIEKTDPRFPAYWEQLWERDAIQYPRYLPTELEAARTYAKDSAFEDRSALVAFGSEPIAGLVLTVQQSPDGQPPRLSAYGRPICWVADVGLPARKLVAAAKLLMNHLHHVRSEHGAQQFSFRDFCAGGDASPFTQRLLQQPDSVPHVGFSQVLDLGRTTEELIAQSGSATRDWLRKNATTQRLRLIEGSDAGLHDIEEFRRLHTEFRGREVRTREAWLSLLNVVKSGQGFLVYGYLGDQLASVAYFAVSSRMCCSRINAVDLGIAGRSWTLALVWHAVRHARELGCQYFEAGERVFPGSWPKPTPKYISMSDNKAVFGGMLRPHIDVVSSDHAAA